MASRSPDPPARVPFPMRPPLAALALVLLPAAALAAPPEVRWDFQPGDTHTYQFDQTSAAKFTSFGQTSEVNTDLAFTLKWLVKEVKPDGSAIVDRTVERVKVTATGGGAEPIDYDSAAADAPDPATLPARLRVLGALAGQTVTGPIAADGTIGEVPLPAKVVRAIAAAGPGNPFGEEQLKLVLSDLGYVLPPAGTEVGGTWNVMVPMPMPFGEIISDRSLTLNSADDRAAVIGVKHTLKPADPDAAGPMTLKEGATDGTVKFDVAEGRLEAVDSTETASLTGPGGFAVELNATSKLRRTGD